MKLDWNKYLGKTLHVTMHENFGLAMDTKANSPIFEIVFKSGTLKEAYDEGFLLETVREKEIINIYIPYQSIKCVEIFNF